MLKYQVIRSFVAVWCAVCLSYTGVRTAIGALTGGADTRDNSAATEARTPTPSTDNPSDLSQTAIDEPEVTVAEEVPVASEEPPTTEEPPTSEAPTTQEAPAVPDAVETPVTVVEEVPAPVETYEVVETPQEVVPDTTPTTEEVIWTEEPVEPVQEEVTVEDSIPSLEEYLSWYTCGSCGRNCSLSNPSCRRGSRLAQLKAQEYYELYGQ